jgi:dihydroorotase
VGLLIRGGTLVLKDVVTVGDVLVDEGRVVRVGKSIESGFTKTVNASGKLVLPGAVDPHVHGREPGLLHKDNFANTTRAAALGGVTTVLEMPNTLPPVDSPERLVEKRELLSGRSFVDFGLYAVLYDYAGDVERRIREMVEAGAIGFKAFMAQTTGNLPPPGFRSLYLALRLSGELGFPVVFHAEDRGCVEYFTELVRSRGLEGLAAYSEARPPLCEELSIEYVASVARAAGGTAYIAHLSTATALTIVERYRRASTRVYVETTPTYLFFDYEEHAHLGALLKVNPPVRSSSNRRELWAALRSGLIDVVGSDHAPHAPYEKRGSIWEASAGVPGVQHLLSLMVHAALEGLIDLGRVVELCSERPAKIFGLYPRKGSLLPGADADIVVVDPSREYVVREDDLAYMHKLAPVLGMKLRGRVEKVLLRGELIVDDGELVVDRPLGSFLTRGGGGRL